MEKEPITLFPYNETALKSLIYDAVRTALSNHDIGVKQYDTKRMIKGIHELADFLRISPARAQKLKNENAFPYFQDGRTLLFDPAVIMEYLQKKKV